MKPIVLIGFPGSGKSTIGKRLAAQLHLQFADLDTAIEDKYHSTIPQLFQKYGEFAFRKCEYATLLELLPQENLVIATGGGAPCFEDAMTKINEKAVSVYLKLSENVLVDRIRLSHKKRPLTQDLNEEELRCYVHVTLQQRALFYDKAQYIMAEEDLLSTDYVDRIIATLKHA